MKEIFKSEDKKNHSFEVKAQDVAHFDQQAVHEVCATFTLAREIEWTTRLFVLDMLDEGEEGIGTHLSIQHLSPALVGEKVNIEASYNRIQDREIICDYVATVRDRVVAKGSTGQKILAKDKLGQIFDKISK